ncbi:MAG: hypothetical protein M1528_02350 [Candidatus Marsarchaeota archaeon]|jgi:sensor histidine kinase YesM|nr:hypothetical protein [Candidatus Marsarchaeota archaeon]MCL5115349.1 hypothetical protein [Candidatus Marsarchaeota archaeon]
MAEKRSIVTIDPELSYRRRLHYMEKHSGWHIFRAVYWGIYIFVIGILLATMVPSTLRYSVYFGWTLILFSLFLIVYGFTSALHLKLMKKYA